MTQPGRKFPLLPFTEAGHQADEADSRLRRPKRGRRGVRPRSGHTTWRRCAQNMGGAQAASVYFLLIGVSSLFPHSSHDP